MKTVSKFASSFLIALIGAVVWYQHTSTAGTTSASSFWIALIGVVIWTTVTFAASDADPDPAPKFTRSPKIMRMLGFDRLKVTDPDIIIKLTQGGSTNMVRYIDTEIPKGTGMPWWAYPFFTNGRMWVDPYGYFMPFRADQGNTRKYLDKKFTPGSFDNTAFVTKVADIILDEKKMNSESSKADVDFELDSLFINAIAGRFLAPDGTGRCPVYPKEIIKAALDQLDVVTDGLNPFKSKSKSKKACLKVCSYVRKQMNDSGDVKEYDLPDGFPSDVGHAVLGGSKHGPSIFRKMFEDPTKDITEIMCTRDRLTDNVIRIIPKDTTFGGMLPADDPAIGGKTIIQLNVGAAARKTQKLSFAFGTGIKERRCAAQPAVIEFVKAVQKEVISRK